MKWVICVIMVGFFLDSFDAVLYNEKFCRIFVFKQMTTGNYLCEVVEK